MADSIDERSIRTNRLRISRVLSPGHRKLNGEISSGYVARLECHSIFCRFLIYSRLLSLTASSYSFASFIFPFCFVLSCLPKQLLGKRKRKKKKKKYDRPRDFMLLTTKTYIMSGAKQRENENSTTEIHRISIEPMRDEQIRVRSTKKRRGAWQRIRGKKRHRKVNSLGSPGTTEAGEKLWRLRRRNSVDCRGFMYAACIRARAQRDLSALGRVSVGQVE